MNPLRLNQQDQLEYFERWMAEHIAIVYRVVNGFASGSDRSDLMQEVMLAVWKAIPAFRGQAKPTTFLYRVCHNAALLWHRRERKHRRWSGELEAFDPETPIAAVNPDAEARLAWLYSAIRGLKPLDRSLILLSLDGLSYREMADILGLSESNVGVKLNRIKQQLTQTLKETENEIR